MSESRLRRIVRLVVAAVVLACGVPCAVTAQSVETLKIAALPIDVSGEPFYAVEQGFFKEAGIDAQVTVLTNGAAVAAALLGGSFDIGVSNLISAATGHEKGLTLTMIAPGALYARSAPTTVCTVAKASPLSTAQDLAGKTIGLPDLFGLPRIAFSAWLDQNNVDPTSVKFVEVPFSAIVPALETKRIDAGILVNPVYQKAVDAGSVRLLSNCLASIAPQFSLAEFYTTAAFAKAHPELVRKFAAVMTKTAAWANAHQRESAEILAKWSKVQLAPNTARARYAERVTLSDYQPVIDAAAKYKLLKSAFPAQEFFSPTLSLAEAR